MQFIELRCKKLSDGSFRGGVFVDDVPDPVLHFDSATCNELRSVWIEARDKYATAPSINGECVDCFPTDFLEAESVPRIDSARDD